MAEEKSRAASKAIKALILVGEEFEDFEFFYPYYRLLEAGIEVDVAAVRKGQVRGKHGYTCEASLSCADAARKKYDLLVIPGGKGPEAVRQDKAAVGIAREMVTSGKLVAAICHGPQVLISAGVLQGRKATCWAGIRDDLKQAGAQYLDREVVVDGNLITSRCPPDLPAFCRELFKKLNAG
jgi:protease I